MAEFSFEEAIAPVSKVTPSKRGEFSFEEAIGKPTKQPATDSGAFHAGSRAAGEAVVPGFAGLTGAVAGGKAMLPYAARAAAFVPHPVAKAVVFSSLELLGAGGGAFVGAEGIGWAQDKLHQLIDPEDYEARKAEREAYPIATTVGGVVGGALGLSPKAAFDPAAKFINTAMKARASAAAGQAGVSAGTQLATKGKIDLSETAIAGATGFVLPGVNPLGKPFAKLGERIGGGSKTEAKPTPEDVPPPPGASPEALEAFKAKQRERAATSPLVEAAIRNKETGEIERMGPKHDPKRKAETIDTHDQGFVDERGVFYDRMEAIDQAKRSKQIPEDHVLENPAGEQPGLHSGDLRAAGDERFSLSPASKESRQKYKEEMLASDEQMHQTEHTTSSLADHLVTKHGPDHYVSKIVTMLKAALPKDMPVVFLDRAEMAAKAKEGGLHENTPGLTTIDGTIYLERGRGTTSVVAAHEIAHAALQDTIHTIENLPKDHPKHQELEVLRNKLTDLMTTVKKEVGQKTLSAKEREALDYALQDPHEFISDGIFKHSVMKHLMEIDRKRPGFISKLVEMVGDFFGFKDKSQYTALHELLEITQEIAKQTGSNKDLPHPDAEQVARGAKMAEDLARDLGEEGIPVTHDSPYRFGGIFNWVENAFSGEGAMVKGAGTYLSTGEPPHHFYRKASDERAKLRAKENHPDYNKYESIRKNSNVIAKERISILADLLKQKEVLKNKSTLHPQVLEATQKRISDLEEKYSEVEKRFNEQQEKLTSVREKIEEDVKDVLGATYQAVLKATPEEIIDFDGTKQSKLVQDAFKRLGVDIKGEAGYGITYDENGNYHFKSIVNDDLYYFSGDDKSGYVATSRNNRGEVIAKGKTEEELINNVFDKETNENKLNFEQEFDNYGRPIGDPTAYGIFNESGKYIISSDRGEYSLRVIKNNRSTSIGNVYKSFDEASFAASKHDLDSFNKENLTGEEAYQELAKKLGDQKEASLALAKEGVVANRHNSAGGANAEKPNYVVFDDSRIKVLASQPRPLPRDARGAKPEDVVVKPKSVKDTEELAAKTTPKVAAASEKVDPRSIANQEEFDKHAADIYDKYGEEEAVKFFEDYEKNKREQSLPIPNDYKSLDDSFHKMNTFQTKDKSELLTWYKNTVKDVKITKAQLEDWFTKRERGEELPPEAQALHEANDNEIKALRKKIKANGGDVGQEFTTGQSRIRLWGDVASNWHETVTELFANNTPYTEKVAEQANAAMERKVFQLDDGRVIELHKQTKDTKTDTRTIRKGTEVWEWKNGKKKMIAHSESDLKLGDKVPFGGREATIVDGNVPDIESHAPYRYLKDSLASQVLAIMALRKQSRDLEFVNNLIKSELFKQVGHGPDQPLKDLPDGWKVPASLDKIPQLRGWHFDPKTAAIIEDFAKVWDNHLLSKMSNAVVKNMMLNPIPHIFNEVMHLWNARGFTSWVPLTGGWSRLASSGSKAWRDVGNQTQFYRDVIREGGSILGADPRNKYFDTLQKEASKDYFKTPEMERSLGNLAKKLGTTVGDLYNGISNKSQQAMWFTRDVMYVQWIHEIMGRHEKRTGSKMELKDAIIEAERHMPNYRMPSEVFGSRGLSKILRNPNVSMFSRYHYGMVKSLVNTIKDINPQNLKSPEGRKHFREGVDSMLAIGVAMAVVYPLMDSLAQAMFGEGAEQRRAGPYHLIHAGEQVIKGERDASALIWPVFTFNPMLLTLGQAAFNKNIFTGKQIYHPDDPAKDIAKDIGTYAAKQIPQVPLLMGVGQDEDTTGQLLAKQLDIKVRTEKQRAATEKAKEREKRAAKARLTKREKGTYKP